PAPPIDGDPLLWKEEHFGGGLPIWKPFLAAGCFVFVGFSWALPPLLLMGEWVLGLVAVVLYASLLIGVTVSAAGSVSREREQRTLDGLLVLPGGREAVLRAKWLGSLWRVRGRAFGLILLLMLGGMTGSLHVLAVAFLAFTAAAQIGFFTSLG